MNHTELEYVRKGDPRSIHTNSIENFRSNFKRGVIGSFHQVFSEHLQRYLNECKFRFNNRRGQDIFSAVIIGLVIKDALRYKALTAKISFAPSEQTVSDGPF